MLKQNVPSLSFYNTEYEKAYYEDDYLTQCTSLAQLAKLYLANKEYSYAAKLINGALAIFESKQLKIDLLKEQLEKQKNFIEEFFLQQEFRSITLTKALTKLTYTREVIGDLERGNAVYEQISEDSSAKLMGKFPAEIKFRKNSIEYSTNVFKHNLDTLRVQVEERLIKLQVKRLKFKHSIKIAKLFEFIADRIDSFLRQLIQECLDIMPAQAPCKFAFISLGSLSRKEITPYSDFEFAILIEQNNSQNFQYFKALSQLLEIKIINLGETSLTKGQKLIKDTIPSPVNKGFSLDIHKNPAAHSSNYQLIGTPKQLADLQRPEFFIHTPTNHLSSSLLNVRLLLGDAALLTVYKQEVQAIYEQRDDQGLTLRQKRTFELLQQDIDTYSPQLNTLESAGCHIQAKDQLYKLFFTGVDSLALYFNLHSNNSLERVDELCKKNFISKDAARHLQHVLSLALFIRLKNYLHYHSQYEDVDILAHFAKRTKSLEHESHKLTIDDMDINYLREIYKTLLPFFIALKEFCHTKGQINPFLTVSLYDESQITLGDIATRLCLYDTAKQHYKKAYKNTPNDLLTLTNLGFIWGKLGNYNKAKKYFNKALDLLEKSDNVPNTITVDILNNLGSTELATGNLWEAWRLLQSAVSIIEINDSKNHPFIINVYNTLGKVALSLDKSNDALNYFNHSLAIAEKLYAKPNSMTAIIYSNLSQVWLNLAIIPKAIDNATQALSISEQVYGNNHPQTAEILNTLGLAYQQVGKFELAKKHFQQALCIHKAIYHKQHIALARDLINLGKVWQELDSLSLAINSFTKALDILKWIGNDHNTLAAKTLSNIGAAYYCQRNFIAAYQYFGQALALDKQLYGKYHHEIACDYEDLGSVYIQLGEIIKASKYYQKALAINRVVYGEQHPVIAICLSNLGHLSQIQKKTVEAIGYCKKAIAIVKKYYGEKHPTLSFMLNNLGLLYLESSKTIEIHQAIDCFTTSLAINQELYGKNHSATADAHYRLGEAYTQIGNILTAIDHFTQALAAAKTYGNDRDIFIYIKKLLFLYLSLGDLLRVIKYGKQFLQLSKNYSAKELTADLQILISLANANLISGDADEAIIYLKLSLKIASVMQNFDHLAGGIFEKLAEAELFLENSSQALKYLHLALALKLKLYGADHPYILQLKVQISKITHGKYHQHTIETLITLGIAWQKNQQIQKALSCFSEALTIAQSNKLVYHKVEQTIKKSIQSTSKIQRQVFFVMKQNDKLDHLQQSSPSSCYSALWGRHTKLGKNETALSHLALHPRFDRPIACLIIQLENFGTISVFGTLVQLENNKKIFAEKFIQHKLKAKFKPIHQENLKLINEAIYKKHIIVLFPSVKAEYILNLVLEKLPIYPNLCHRPIALISSSNEWESYLQLLTKLRKHLRNQPDSFVISGKQMQDILKLTDTEQVVDALQNWKIHNPENLKLPETKSLQNPIAEWKEKLGKEIFSSKEALFQYRQSDSIERLRITIFSSTKVEKDKYSAIAQQLGQVIGKSGSILVNGGVDLELSLTWEAAQAALQAGSPWIELIYMTKFLSDQPPACLDRINTQCKVAILDNIEERKEALIKHIDIFISFCGGIGSLCEIEAAVEAKHKGIIPYQTPIIIAGDHWHGYEDYMLRHNLTPYVRLVNTENIAKELSIAIKDIQNKATCDRFKPAL